MSTPTLLLGVRPRRSTELPYGEDPALAPPPQQPAAPARPAPVLPPLDIQPAEVAPWGSALAQARAAAPDPADVAAARYLAPGNTDAPAWAPPVEPVPPNPNPVDYRRPSERYRDEYNELGATEPKDRNGRIKSFLANAFYQMSRQAQAVTDASTRSGRPVDAYGLASVAGSGIGGGIAGAFNPAIDERMKRDRRMGELEHLIGTQLEMEKIEEARQQQALENELKVQGLDVQRERLRRAGKPRAQVINGVLFDSVWDDEMGRWRMEPQQSDGKLITDPSKQAGADGLTPFQRETVGRWGADREARKQLSAERIAASERAAAVNRKWRTEEADKDRLIRREQHAERMKLGFANYEQRLRDFAHRVEKDATEQARKAAAEKRANARVAITYAKAKKWAEDEGIDFPDFIEIMNDSGVEVTDK